MNTREALKQSLEMGEFVSLGYLQDMTDEEMMHRPAEKSNHIKWQLGHLITAENFLIEKIAPGQMPALPEGFGEKYSKETSGSDDATAFDSKEELLNLYKTQREGTCKILESMSDEDFDKETGIDYAPTAGAIFSMQGSHYLMHAGQWAVTRRQLGREPMF